MKPHLLILACLAVCAVPVGAARAEALAAAQPPGLERAQAVLEDPERRFTIDEVSRPPLSDRFEARAPDVINFGMTRSAWWVRLQLENTGPRDLERMLVFGWPLTDELALYSRRADAGFDVVEAGDRRPFGEREIAYRNPVFPVAVAVGETRVLWLRLAGDDALIAPISLVTPEELVRTRVAESFRFGAFYALIAIMVLYNLAFYLSTRDSSYLYLVGVVTFASGWHFSVDGLAYQWLWPDSPWWANHSIGFFGSLTAGGFAALVRSFVLSRRYAPIADRILAGLVAGTPVFCAIALWDMHIFNILALPIAVFFFGGALAAAIRARQEGFSPGGDFLIVYTIALACLSLYGVDATFGVFQSGVVQTYGLQAGFLGSGVLLTVALGRRLAVLQQEGLRAESLRRAKEDADHASSEKSRFLASASHDLRQPLHSLGLFVGSLAHKVRDPAASDLIERIQASYNAMEQMFDAVLDISKLDAGVLEPEQRIFALNELLDSLRVEFESQAAGRHLRLRVVGSSLAVQSDPLLLLRILRNLVTNALRYTDRGGVVVGVRRAGAEAVRIEVHDSGRGIPEERQSQVFEEYRRIEGSGRPVTEGLGLGLAIVDRLAKLLGHEVALHSTPGRGSVFSITVGRAELPADAPSRSELVAVVADVLAGRVVMVVDEDPEIVEGMRELLRRWDCTVLAGQSMGEARAVIDGMQLDAIISDYDLGGGSTGIDAIGVLRELSGSPVPALLITGDTSPERSAEAQRHGLLLLHKPVAPARLRAALMRLVRESPPGA